MEVRGIRGIHNFREAIRADLVAMDFSEDLIARVLLGLSEMVVNPLVHNGDEVVMVKAEMKPSELILCLRSGGYQDEANGSAFVAAMSSPPKEFSLKEDHGRGGGICAALFPNARYLRGAGFVEAILPLPAA